MLAFLRKHTILAILIFGATIVSFVVFMSPNGSPGGGGRPASGDTVIGSAFNEPITYEEYLQAFNESRLNFLFRVGEFPENYPQAAQMGWNDEQQAMNRLIAVKKQQQLGIKATDPAVVEQIRNIPSFKGGTADGPFDKRLYDMFMTNTLSSRGITKASFEDFIRHEVGMSRTSALVGIAGELVTPEEAKEAIRYDFRQAQVKLVVFKGSNYVNDITVDPAELEEYYQQVQASYRLPERRSVEFVAFPYTNYVEQAQLMISTNANFETQIEATYSARGTDSFLNEDGTPMTAEAAKQKLRDEILDQAKAYQAKAAAYQFANEVFAVGQTNLNATLDVYQNEFKEAATTAGLTVETSEPFSQYQPPVAMNGTTELSTEAFRLSAINPYGILVGNDAFYIAVLNEIIPSEAQPLEDVRPSVESAFRNQKIRDAVRAEADEFYTTLTNQISEGKSFSEVAQETDKTVIEPPVFSAQDTSIEGYSIAETGVSVSSLVNSTFSLSPGSTSKFIANGQNGYFVHLENFVDVSEEKVNEEYEATLESMRSQRRTTTFSDWFGQELEQAQPALYTGEEEPSETTVPTSEI